MTVMTATAATAVMTLTLLITAYAPSPEACAIRRTNCANVVRPTMASGLIPFVGAAACSDDMPLGTSIKLIGAPSVTGGGRTFVAPSEIVCLDRFGSKTVGPRRVDLVLLVPEDPGRTELALADAWGRREVQATVAIAKPARVAKQARPAKPPRWWTPPRAYQE